MNVIAILDIGKTNKKLFLFDEQYRIVWEQSSVFDSTVDEDGDVCEHLPQLTDWAYRSLATVAAEKEFSIRALNFSAYGASFVYVGEDGTPVAPLYNYLKTYPESLKKKFYDAYGGEMTFSMLTASPVLGSLNSGMQLYRIKEEQPALFARIRHALHLPQYLCFLFTGVACSDLTSIGCHTNLWNFSQQHYHEWVYREGVIDKLAPIVSASKVYPLRPVSNDDLPAFPGPTLLPSIPKAGIGLHDSSAAMIPYLESFREPFVLISTGTWCITMNPFNEAPLTVAELQKDCLCYMTYQGRPVKASRLFAGYEHEQQVQRLSEYFHKQLGYVSKVEYNPDTVELLRAWDELRPLPGTGNGNPDRGGASDAASSHAGRAASAEAGGSRAARTTAMATLGASAFGQRDLSAFEDFDQAYHRLIMDLMEQQVASTKLVLHSPEVKRIFVDGGFGKNQIYMHLLAEAFPDIEVFAASIPQATAMGAALAIHSHWNTRILPGDIIELKYYK